MKKKYDPYVGFDSKQHHSLQQRRKIISRVLLAITILLAIAIISFLLWSLI